MEKKSIRGVNEANRLEEWAVLVRECRNSGLNVVTWCEQKGITTNQFYKWQRKVFDALMAQQEQMIPALPESISAASVPCFAELPAPAEELASSQALPSDVSGNPQLAATPRTTVIATLRIGSAEIDIYTGADVAVVEALCKAVSHAQ